MKKIVVLLSTSLLVILFSFACKKKETCKQCGWYDKTTGTQVIAPVSTCGDAIATFEAQGEQSYTQGQTTAVKTASIRVPKCQ